MNFSAPLGSTRNSASYKQPQINGKSQSSRMGLVPEHQTQTTDPEINSASNEGNSGGNHSSSLLSDSNSRALSSRSLRPSQTQATQKSNVNNNQSEEISQRLKDDKIHDLHVLHKMYLCIAEYKAGQMSEQDVILRISELSGGEDGLSFNDRGDINTYAIRNRYGHVQRNKDGNERYEGYARYDSESVRINFSDLFKLQIIYKCCQILPTDIASQINILESKLICILQKEINESHELPKEKLPKLHINNITNGSSTELDKISLFVTENYYNKLAISKIEEEVNVLREFTLTDNLSIYYAARKIVLIGELCNEIKERFNSPNTASCEHSYSPSLFKICSYANKLRNLFIHKDLHRTLIFYKKNSQEEFEKISKLFQNFFESFYTILKNELSDTKVSQDPFLECMTGENNLYAKLNILSPDSLQNQLNDHVIQAKTIVDIVNSDEYKLILKCLDKEVLRRNSDKEVSNLLLMIIQSLSNKESVNINDAFSRLNNLCTLLNNAKDPEINEIVSTINQCVRQIKEKFLTWPDDITAHYFNSSFSAISASYKKLIRGMNDVYKSVFATYDVDLSMSKPDELNALANSVKADPNIFNKFNVLLKKVNEEIALIRDIEHSDSIEKEKKSVIIEFATAVIGQYLNALAYTKTSSVDNFNSSHVLQDAKKTAVMERSNGLAHQVLNFNKEKFSVGLNDNILPAYRSFKALNRINTQSVSTHEDIEVAFSLAKSFLRLKLYAQAAEHYKKCLDYANNPENVDGASEIDAMIKKMSGIDYLELFLTRMLTLCYVLNNEPEKAKACSEKTLEKIMNAKANAPENFDMVLYMKPELVFNIAHLVDHIANAYGNLHEFAKALELYNYALLFADEEHKQMLLLGKNYVSNALQNNQGRFNTGSGDMRLNTTYINQSVQQIIGGIVTSQSEKQIVATNTTALDFVQNNKRSLKEHFGEAAHDIELLSHADAFNNIDLKQAAATIIQQFVDIENNTNKINASNDQKAYFYLKICDFLNGIADNAKRNKPNEALLLLNKVEYYLARAYELYDPGYQSDYVQGRLENLIHSYCKDTVFIFKKLNDIAIKLLGFSKKYNANNNLIWFYLSRKYMSIASQYFGEQNYSQAKIYCDLASTSIKKVSTEDLVFTNIKGTRQAVAEGMKHAYFYIDYTCNSQLAIISHENSLPVNASVYFKQAMESINKALKLDPKNPAYLNEKNECIALQKDLSQQSKKQPRKQPQKQPIRRNQKK